MATAPSAITVPLASTVTTGPPVTMRLIRSPDRAVRVSSKTASRAANTTTTATKRIGRTGRFYRVPVVYSSGVPVHLVQHPIVQDALISLRDRSTNASHFRRLTHRLSLAV